MSGRSHRIKRRKDGSLAWVARCEDSAKKLILCFVHNSHVRLESLLLCCLSTFVFKVSCIDSFLNSQNFQYYFWCLCSRYQIAVVLGCRFGVFKTTKFDETKRHQK